MSRPKWREVLGFYFCFFFSIIKKGEQLKRKPIPFQKVVVRVPKIIMKGEKSLAKNYEAIRKPERKGFGPFYSLAFTDCSACFIFNVRDFSVLKMTPFNEALHCSEPVLHFLLLVLCREDTLPYWTPDRWECVRGATCDVCRHLEIQGNSLSCQEYIIAS